MGVDWKQQITKRLGSVAQDQVTGFTGVVTSRCDSMLEGVQYAITSTLEDGTKITHWVGEGRIVF